MGRMNQVTQYSSHEREPKVFATSKLMQDFCCWKSRRKVQSDSDVQAYGIVTTATAVRFNLLRKFTLRVREPSPQFSLTVLQQVVVATATAARFNLLCKLAFTAISRC